MANVNKNYDKLPNFCWGVVTVEKGFGLILIAKGERGYHPTDYEPFDTYEAADEFCNRLNKQIDVESNVRKAMENGSMFGWHVPGADPENKTNILYNKEN